MAEAVRITRLASPYSSPTHALDECMNSRGGPREENPPTISAALILRWAALSDSRIW